MTTTQIIEKVELLEDRIEEIKYLLANLFAANKMKSRSASIVRTTCGILCKSFPAGTRYENRIRKSWGKRFEKPK